MFQRLSKLYFQFYSGSQQLTEEKHRQSTNNLREGKRELVDSRENK